ncbi:MAG: transcription-repair coupling factor [Actinomycetota bacterium]|nr:transcription-repair coupling factor [Actinomycetota bacterium]
MNLEPLLSLWEKNRSFKRLRDAIQAQEGINVSIPSPLRPYLVAMLFKSLQRPLLVVTSNVERAQRFAKDVRNFLPASAVHHFLDWEILPWERISPNKEIIAKRLEILYLLENKSLVVITTAVQSLMQRLPPRKSIPKPIVLEVGIKLDLYHFIEDLLKKGYKRTYMVEGRGEFSVRGGIVDVFPGNLRHPLRIEFFGDEVDSMREFAISTQRSISTLDRTLIFPCREFVLTPENVKKALDFMGNQPALPNWKEDIDRLQNLTYFEGVERYIPFLYDQLSTLFDFLPRGCSIILDETTEIEEELERFHRQQLDYLGEAISTLNIPSPPVPYFISPKDLFASLDGRLDFISIKVKGPKETIQFKSLPVEPILGRFDRLAELLKKFHKDKYAAVIVLRDKGQARRMLEILEELGTCPSLSLEKASIIPGEIGITLGDLGEGFIIPSLRLCVLSEGDIFAKRYERRIERRTVEAIPITSYMDLKQGDLVVHANHGIARYAGLVREKIGDAVWDCLVLEYADGKLKVRVDQMDKISKYIGSDVQPPPLSRLGGGDWIKVKRRVKRSVKKLAFDLLTLYAERAQVQGFSFSPDSPWQRELEDSFPYDETPDQLKAVAEVKEDMETSKPMDRLICGDVGYGKTEVAIRASFKAIMDGKQVMVLAPTTILVQQHFNTFQSRFSSFPIIMECLSRFKLPREQRDILKRFAEGKIDVLIGTHRLLQRDVVPKNLGLVIIDDEQRFGVAHKEHLRNLKKTVDVLTLSATPIPRTLQMSLSGIRDLSIINTPPEDRYPILTYVGEYDETMVREAIRRELERCGQIYYVYNRVETIDKVAQRVKGLAPMAKVAVAHGQMPQRELEKVMLDFLDKKYDVLVCTTIIEAGIDIPSVNTLIVEEAQELGLTQLYQLRGRVGRSNHRAYAYFFFNRDIPLTSTACDRLKTIGELTELGSGLKIALRDLEIRGAGNLLGPEQHGYLQAVGFDLYCQLLRQAIEQLKGKPVKKLLEVRINLPVKAYIPEEYIREEILRIEAYRRIASIQALDQAREVKEELQDRYGPLPRVVQNLVEICRIKALAQEARVSNISWKENRLMLHELYLTKGRAVALQRKYPNLMYKPHLKTLLIRIDASEILSFLVRLFSDIIHPSIQKLRL